MPREHKNRSFFLFYLSLCIIIPAPWKARKIQASLSNKQRSSHSYSSNRLNSQKKKGNGNIKPQKNEADKYTEQNH